MDPKLKGVKKEIQEREYILKVNNSVQPECTHPNRYTKGRNNTFSFHPQNCPLTK